MDCETKQLLRVIAAALTAIAECKGKGLGDYEPAAAAFRWLQQECDLLATYRKDP